MFNTIAYPIKMLEMHVSTVNFSSMLLKIKLFDNPKASTIALNKNEEYSVKDGVVTLLNERRVVFTLTYLKSFSISIPFGNISFQLFRFYTIFAFKYLSKAFLMNVNQEKLFRDIKLITCRFNFLS